MKISLAFIVGALLFGMVLTPRSTVHSSSQPKSGRPLYVPGEVLVQLREAPAAFETPNEVAGQILPLRSVAARTVPDSGPAGLYVVKIANNVSVEQAVAEAEKNPRVEFAEPNYYYYPTDIVPDDPLFPQEWDLLNTGIGPFGGSAGADIEATKAWSITTGSDDVVVAVTDTGIDLSHPELAPNAWVNPGEIAGNGVDDDNNGFVDDINGWNFVDNNNQLYDPSTGEYHGTHVTGTIGAVGNDGVGTAGVAWHVKLMGLKFIGPQGGTTADAVAAINYATMERKRGINVRAINASWAGPKPSKSLRKAIIKAGNAGILFVCAAGNGDNGIGSNLDDPSVSFYPAAWNDIPTLISVAATDNSDRLASFSNYGHIGVSIAAPGVGIYSTLPNDQYGPLQGTSMATPHVVGVAALLAATEPGLGPADVKQRILSTAVPLLNLASKVESSARLDAFNALTDHVPAPGSPQIASVSTDKKFVTVDGLGFINGSSVIEVSGAALAKMKYDPTYQLANGTSTQLRAKVGKANMDSVFPPGQAVVVTVFNPTTGETSAQFSYVR